MSYAYTLDNPTFTQPPTASYILITQQKVIQAPLPYTLLQMVSTDGQPCRMLLDSNNSSSNFGSSIRGRRTRGTSVLPLGILNGDVMLQVTCDGYNGSQFSSNSAAMNFFAAENWDTASQGTYIQFRVTQLGTTSSIVALQIGPNGYTYGTFSGSLIGTSSVAISASYAPSSPSISASYAVSASYSPSSPSISASYALSSSYAPAKSHVEFGIVSGSAFTGSPKSLDIIYTNAFPNSIYTVSIIGDEARMWSTSNRSSTGFTINTNSNIALTQMVMWRVEG